VRRTRRWRSPRWPGGTVERCTTPSGSPRSTTGTSPEGRCSRTSASGSGPATTRCPARTWTPRCCASAPPCVAASGSWTPRRSA
jgi:hypothetical protein